MTDQIPYVYILGLAHSGSTLLTFLLNAHPEIATLGEIERLRTFIPDRWRRKKDSCSCGHPFYECPYWNRVLAGFAARGHGFDEVDYFEYRPEHKQTADEKLKALAASVLDVSEKRVFLDASKFPQYVTPLLANPNLDLRVINLHRDGRAAVNSWLKRIGRNPAYRRVPEDWQSNRLLRTYVVGRIILEWRRREKERRKAAAQIPPERVLSIRYEDLAGDPEGVLPGIFSFLGVSKEVDVIEGYKSQVEHHIIGNQMRLNAQENIVLDEKWRQDMHPDSLRLFAFLGGLRLNRLAGYED